jgi:hypothetical protein
MLKENRRERGSRSLGVKSSPSSNWKTIKQGPKLQVGRVEGPMIILLGGAAEIKRRIYPIAFTTQYTRSSNANGPVAVYNVTPAAREACSLL